MYSRAPYGGAEAARSRRSVRTELLPVRGGPYLRWILLRWILTGRLKRGETTLTTNEAVRFENFENLVRAYEQLLSERGRKELIPANQIRPKLLARLFGTPPSEAYFIVESLAKEPLQKSTI